MTLSEAGLASMAYFYFDFRDLDKQHIRNLLPSLLIQLSAQSVPRRDIFYRLYLAHDNGEKKPSVGVMMQCLKEMLTISDQRPIYIILDALDECSNLSGILSPREQVLRLSRTLLIFTYLISIYASPAAPNSISRLRLDHSHFTVCPFMTKVDKRRTSSTTSILLCSLTPRR